MDSFLLIDSCDGEGIDYKRKVHQRRDQEIAGQMLGDFLTDLFFHAGFHLIVPGRLYGLSLWWAPGTMKT